VASSTGPRLPSGFGGSVVLERLTGPWKLAWLVVVSVSAVLAVYFDVLKVENTVARLPYRPDFTVFWTASEFSRLNPRALYDTAVMTQAQVRFTGAELGPRPWVSPPSFLLWLWPFTRLSPWAAMAAWTAFGVAAFGSATWSMTRSWIATLFSPLAPAALTCVLNGQTSLVTGAALLWGCSQLQRRPILAGLAFGLAATIKPQALVAVPLALVAGRHWRALGAATLGGAGACSMSFALGPQLWFDWIHDGGRFLDLVRSMGLLSQSVTPVGLALQMGFETPGMLCAYLVGVGAAIVLVWRAFSSKSDPALQGAALAAGALLMTPYAMFYEAAALGPVALWIFARCRREPPMWLAAAFALIGIASCSMVAACLCLIAGVILPARPTLSAAGRIPAPSPP
jgi:hypothetical protein